MESVKKCMHCGEYKFLSSFYYDSNSLDKRQAWCSECNAVVKTCSKYKPPKKIKPKKEKIPKIVKSLLTEEEKIKHNKISVEKFKQKHPDYSKEYYQKNKEKRKQYYIDNKEKISEYQKQYREKNKEKLKNNADFKPITESQFMFELGYRKCSMCNKWEPLKEFIKNSCKCKSCRKKIAHEYYLNNKEHLCEINKQWKIDNKDRYDKWKEEYKDIKKEKDHEYYLNNKEYILEKQRYKNALHTSASKLMYLFGYTYCYVCKTWKPIKEFYKNSSKIYGISNECKECKKKYNRRYRKINKDKINEINKIYRKNNPDIIKKQRKRYYNKYKKLYLKRNRIYRETHKKEIKEYRDSIKDYMREYRKSDIGKLSHLNTRHRRRMQIKSTPKEFRLTQQDIDEILTEQDNICVYCGREFSDELPATLDHIIPLSKGGEHTRENAQMLCRSCNAKKGNKLNYTP